MARYTIDLIAMQQASRLESLQRYYEVSQQDICAVKQLEKLEVLALEKMQNTISYETNQTERLISSLKNDDHRKFFFAAASRSQLDKSFESIEGHSIDALNSTLRTTRSKSKSPGMRGKRTKTDEARWKWKP